MRTCPGTSGPVQSARDSEIATEPGGLCGLKWLYDA